MSGNRTGGLKSAADIKKRLGEDHFAKIGQLGGRVSRGGGFQANSENTRLAGLKGGKLGGRRSKPNHKFVRETDTELIYIYKPTGETKHYPKI